MIRIGDAALKDLATLLHNRFCHASHEDWCSWHYEHNRAGTGHDWDALAHKHWLGIARDMAPDLQRVLS